MKQEVIFVVGMHRSGTSLAMQLLEKLGVEFGNDLLEANEFNQRGYFEAPEILNFHDEILGNHGRTWGLPEHAIPLTSDFFSSEEGKSVVNEVKSLLAKRLSRISKKRTLAIKDPRLTLFIPIWIQAAEELGCKTKFIVCVRNPNAVASSLGKRDQLDIDLSHAYWINYTAASIFYTKGYARKVCIFDKWNSPEGENYSSVAKLLGVDPIDPTEFLYDSKLTIGSSTDNEPNPLTHSWWTTLQNINEGQKKIERKAHEFLLSSITTLAITNAIRTEVGETQSYLLARDLNNHRVGLNELTAKYEADQRWISEQNQALDYVKQSEVALQDRVSKLCDQLLGLGDQLAVIQQEHLKLGDLYSAESARSKELLEAYQNSEKTISELTSRLQEFDELQQEHLKLSELYSAESARSKELLEANQTLELDVIQLNESLVQTEQQRTKLDIQIEKLDRSVESSEQTAQLYLSALGRLNFRFAKFGTRALEAQKRADQRRKNT